MSLSEPGTCAVVGGSSLFVSVLGELGVPVEHRDRMGDLTGFGSVIVVADRYPEVLELDDAEALASYVRTGGRAYVEYAIDRTGFLPEPSGPPRVAGFERIYVARSNDITRGFEPLTIFDEHGSHTLPVSGSGEVLSYGRVAGAHRAVFGPADESWPALLDLRVGDGRLLYASTAFSNAERGRYRPAARWRVLIRNIVAALQPEPVDITPVEVATEPKVWAPSGEQVRLRVTAAAGSRIVAYAGSMETVLAETSPGVYESEPLLLPDGRHTFTVGTSRATISVGPRDQRYQRMVDYGIDWFHRAGMFFDAPDGSAGVAEGFSNELGPDGMPPFRPVHRGDGYVQVAHAFRMYGELTADRQYTTIADNLMAIVVDRMQLTDRNALYGSWEPRGVRTDLTATNNLFADDNGWISLFVLASGALPQGLRGVETLVRSANAELGLQVDPWRTPSTLLTRGWAETARTPISDGLDVSSHWQSSALSAYLYAYGVTGERRYLDVATRGLDHMAKAFPRTRLETSRTCEAVRFVLPLVGGYQYTQAPLYLDTLRAIAAYLKTRQDPISGALLEWDGRNPTSNAAYGVDEASIFQANGDPVSDQLYCTGYAAMSLPLASKVEPAFGELATGVLDFLSRIQIDEGDELLDGTWMRAFDVQAWEYYGSNADIGWGPYCVETGWSHAPSLIGAMLYLSDADLFPPPGADRTGLAAQIKAEFDRIDQPATVGFTRDADGRIVREQGGVSTVLGDLIAAGEPVWVENPPASAVEIYVRGVDGRLYHSYLHERLGQGNWRPVGELVVAGDPAVAFNPAAGAVEVYVRGADELIHHASMIDVRAGHGPWEEVGSLGSGVDPVVAFDNDRGTVVVSAGDRRAAKENRWHPPWVETSRWVTA